MENVLRILEGTEWNELWLSLRADLFIFPDFQLDQRTPDSVIWRRCQTEKLILVNANRNMDGEDSLAWVIRTEGSENDLPVLTVSDGEALKSDREYVRRVSIRILEIMFDIEKLRGTGRLYIP